MNKRILILLICLLFGISCAAEESQPVTDEPAPRLRMLCCSVSNYEDGRHRTGGLNSAQGIYDAFKRAFPENGYNGIVLSDPSEEELSYAIASLFASAGENDISLIYLNGHGGSEGGVSWLETREGAHFTAPELEAITRRIPGRVILLIDCCNSGGYIGIRSEDKADIPDCFASDKYLVLTSCTADEDSYRIARDRLTEDQLATVFARSLCEGIGWDLIDDRPCALKADTNGDRLVSFSELFTYISRRCRYYLSASAGTVQTVCRAPQASCLTAASRRSEE